MDVDRIVPDLVEDAGQPPRLLVGEGDEHDVDTPPIDHGSYRVDAAQPARLERARLGLVAEETDDTDADIGSAPQHPEHFRSRLALPDQERVALVVAPAARKAQAFAEHRPREAHGHDR